MQTINTNETTSQRVISSEVTRIKLPVFDGNLFAETDGIDVDASVRRYAEMVSERLSAAFPNAGIDVDIQRGTGGCCPAPTVFLGDDWSEDLAETVSEIESQVWSEFGWVVNAE